MSSGRPDVEAAIGAPGPGPGPPQGDEGPGPGPGPAAEQPPGPKQAGQGADDAPLDAPEPHHDVVIEPLPTAVRVRRAGDVLRLLMALAVVIAAQLLAALAHSGVRVTERALLESIVTLPAALRDWLSGLVQVAMVLFPVAFVAVLVGGRRFGLLWRLLLAAATGTAAAVLISHLLLANSRPLAWAELLSGRGGVFDVKFPPVAWLAGATAMLTVGGPELSRRWRRGLWWAATAAAVVEVVVGGFLPVDAVIAGALGVSVGSLILVAFGGPTGRPSADEVVTALQQCGVELTALRELASPAPGPASFRASMPDGRPLIVKVLADEDRDRDRLSRLYRLVMLRDADDDRAGTTMESAAEHEMLAMVAAARAGARVPEPVVAYPVAGRQGSQSALVAWVDVGGRRFEGVGAKEVSDVVLADLWHSVRLLQEHRLAHRLLRTENILLDDDGHAWLTGLTLAELGASDRQLRLDVAELLVSLAVQVGVQRAVASAVAVLGPSAVEAAAAYVQPLPLSATTRSRAHQYDRGRAVHLVGGPGKPGLRPGGRPDLLRDVRAEVASTTATPPAKPEPLSRFTWKRTLALLGGFVVIYVLVPQIANAGAAIRALQDADWWWVLAALPAIFVVEVFAALLQLGAIPAELPFRPTYVIEFGGSFLNKVTPNGVGGMALSFRYLQKAGVDPGAATGSVGLQSVVSTVANLVLAAAFFAATGRKSPVHFSVAGHQWVFIAVAVVLAALALVALTPPGRRFFHDKIWGFLRSAGTTVAGVAKSPRHVAQTLGGSLGWPMVEVVAFALCVHAVGGTLPFVQVAAVYMGSNLLASVAPTPGGLGALEAALVAGLSGLGMPAGAAASAVLIFRLLTFWLAIPIGWISLKTAERRGYV